LVDVPVSSVDDLQGPSALGLFAPEVDAEERPVVEVGAHDVPGPLEQQRGRGAHRGSQQDAQVAPREEPQGHPALHVLKEANLKRSHHISVTRTRVYVKYHVQVF